METMEVCDVFARAARSMKRGCGMGWVEFAEDTARLCKMYGLVWCNKYFSAAHTIDLLPEEAVEILRAYQADD